MFERQWGHMGKQNGEFHYCIGIAVGKDNNIYTCEFGNRRIQIFTPQGEYLRQFPIQEFGGGIAVDRKGSVYVAHWNSSKITAYDSAGKIFWELGIKGTAVGEFQIPGSIALGPDGLLYVPDQGNSRIQKFTTAGKFVENGARSVPSQGSSAEQN